MQRPAAVFLPGIQRRIFGIWHQRLCLVSTALWSVLGTPDGDVYEEWFSDYTGFTWADLPDARDGLPQYSLQPGDLRGSSKFRTQLELDALTAPSVPIQYSPTLSCPCFLPPAENAQDPWALSGSLLPWRRVTLRSEWVTSRSATQSAASFDETTSLWPWHDGVLTAAPICWGLWRPQKKMTFVRFVSMSIPMTLVPVPSPTPWGHCARTFCRTFLSAFGTCSGRTRCSMLPAVILQWMSTSSCASFWDTGRATTNSIVPTWRSRRPSPGACSFGRSATRRNCVWPLMGLRARGMSVNDISFWAAPILCERY